MRKLLLAALSSLVCAASSPARESEFFSGGETVVFIGDSITQDGRFIAYIQAFLDETHPGHGMTLLNFGLSAETASGTTEVKEKGNRPHVFSRLRHILGYRTPDVTFLCYGMNDGGYHPRTLGRFTAYTYGMSRLIDRVASTGSRIVLLTPPPFDAASSPKELQPDTADSFDYNHPYEGYASAIGDYASWCRGQLAAGKVDAVVDINSVLTAYIASRREADPSYSHGDGVHPGEDGHYVWAEAIVRDLAGEDAVEALAAWKTPAFNGRWNEVLETHKKKSAALRLYSGAGTKDPVVIGNRARLNAALESAAARLRQDGDNDPSGQ